MNAGALATGKENGMSRLTAEAYDFSLFEEHRGEEYAAADSPRWDNAQPQEEPRRERREKPKDNVVELPQQERRKAKKAKVRRHPLRTMAAVLACGIMFSTVTMVIFNQVQLTELTEEINQTTQQLQEAESLEIQLNMEASQEMDGAAVEDYAQNELGMSKIVSGQVTYVDSVGEDQGTVVREAGGGSLLEKLWSVIQSWFQ